MTFFRLSAAFFPASIQEERVRERETERERSLEGGVGGFKLAS